VGWKVEREMDTGGGWRMEKHTSKNGVSRGIVWPEAVRLKSANPVGSSNVEMYAATAAGCVGVMWTAWSVLVDVWDEWVRA
jgi:hypothetical protein